jgi:hypothetical protein
MLGHETLTPMDDHMKNCNYIKPCPYCLMQIVTDPERKLYDRHIQKCSPEVKCPDCHKFMPAGVLEYCHYGCEMKIVECNDCCERVRRHELTDRSHADRCSGAVMKQCDWCNRELRRRDLPHVCPFEPLPCPNACDVKSICRIRLEQHLLVCDETLVNLKCECANETDIKRVKRKDAENHICWKFQMASLKGTILGLRQLLEAQKAKIQNLTQLAESLAKQIQELADKNPPAPAK